MSMDLSEAKLIKDIVLSLKEQIEELRDKIKNLEKTSTIIHNHYHNTYTAPQPTYPNYPWSPTWTCSSRTEGYPQSAVVATGTAGLFKRG
jgi:hypothetical protein